MSKKCPPQSEAGSSNTTITTITATIITKESKSRHVTTEAEKAVLTPYFENSNPSVEETDAILDLLLKLLPDYWTRQKVKNVWGYMQRKKKNITQPSS